MKKYVVLAAIAAFVCLMAFLSLGKPPEARADDDDEGAQATFAFTAASRAKKGKELHQVALSGFGKFNKKNVEGGGKFNHIIVTATTPFPVVDHGAWKAKKLVSFKSITPTPYGNQLAGILTMKVNLMPDGGPVIRGVTMTVVCNIAAIPALTGKDEGVTLDKLDGLTFEPFGAGITAFFTPGAEDDD